jgi:hypothetical protein
MLHNRKGKSKAENPKLLRGTLNKVKEGQRAAFLS